MTAPENPAVVAFAPGRMEIAGNHTDHQHGVVVGAAVELGVSARAWPSGSREVRGTSDGFGPFAVDLDDLRPREGAQGTPEALVRGVLDAFYRRGVDLQGFDVRFTSTVPAGAGLSSSAAFELAVAATCNLLFAEGRFGAVELAQMGMYAEREHFGKPCGLQDQLASACGGIVEMDFEDPGNPVVRPLDFDFENSGYAVCLVDSRSDHSRFNDEFAAIPEEMRAVARLFGQEALRHVPESDFWDNLALVRARLGDRPALRAMHFFAENRSVQARARALREGDMPAFLRLTNESGVSSAELLQNVFSARDSRMQPAMVALAVVRRALAGRGACRIHGGGFGGCIQAFVPADALDGFIADVEGKLGSGVCRVLTLGHPGATARWV